MPKWRYDFNCRKCDNIQFIDDPARVWVGSIPDSQKGKEGLRIKDMLKYHNAVAGINASGFNDPLENGT